MTDLKWCRMRMAKELGMKTVSEGVELRAQIGFLKTVCYYNYIGDVFI